MVPVAPTRSPTNRAPGDSTASFGESARSIEVRTLSAFTGALEGGANLRSVRRVNVYVLPPFETRGIAIARSARSADPLRAGSVKASSIALRWSQTAWWG